MAHKTLIGGTAYEIGGGKTPVGGTAYSIDKGKTLVGGTAYEIAFASPITVVITGTGLDTKTYVQINGTQYSAATTLEIEPGTSIYVCAYSRGGGKISFNGTSVDDDNSSYTATYTFVPDCDVVNIALSSSSATITTS